MEKIHYNIVVRGRVQGVWFRKFTKENADQLNLYGFVKNDLEGTVYIEAEGEKEILEQFIDRLRIGTPLSKVAEVIFEGREIQHFTGFEIKRTKA